MLTRKKIHYSWRLKREEAIKEAAHLQRPSHANIIRGVGTYDIGKVFSILLYPAMTHNLESLLGECADIEGLTVPSTWQRLALVHMRLGLRHFIGCLTHTLAFIHGRFVKHMDIKPTNLLVHIKSCTNYKVYIADFGISRSYAKAADAETDSLTPFTKAYAAPEVVHQGMRGFSAGTQLKISNKRSL
jgi:serine/threonine protein kinase